MKNNSKEPILHYMQKYTHSIAPGANGGFVYRTLASALHTVLDSLTATDGRRSKAKSIRISILAYSTGQFIMTGGIVQTAGAFADTTNSTGRTFESLLDAAIDDTFGYRKITQTKQGVPWDVEAGNELFRLELTYDIPGDIIALLNKETDTERLQSIIPADLGIGVDGKTIIVNAFITIAYTEIAVGLIHR
jgi:hypothetical protein